MPEGISTIVTRTSISSEIRNKDNITAAGSSNFNSATSHPQSSPSKNDDGAAKKLVEQYGLKAGRGRMSRFYEFYPFPTDEREFSRNEKQEIKNAYYACLLELFNKGCFPDEKTAKELRDTLIKVATEGKDLNKSMLKLVENYIKKKAKVENLHFRATKDGGVFPVKGTNLDAEVFRSKQLELFQVPDQISEMDQVQLKSQDHTGNNLMLGKGATATALLARHWTEDGLKFVAVKKFKNLAYARNELKIVNIVQPGPYVSKVLEHVIDADQAFLFTELASCGDGLAVQNRLARITDPQLDIKAQRTLAKHYIKAVLALKNQDPPINHLDIKPDNFLVLGNGSVILIDFGMATTDGKCGDEGTVGFMDPRMNDEGASAANADKYSLGVTLHTLATGRYPNEGRVENGKWVPEKTELWNWEGFDAVELKGEDLYEVALMLMDKVPANRPSLEKVLTLPYFSDGENDMPTLSNAEFAALVKPAPPETDI